MRNDTALIKFGDDPQDRADWIALLRAQEEDRIVKIYWMKEDRAFVQWLLLSYQTECEGGIQ